MARPIKFKEEYIEQVEKLCKLGATDKEIADFFEVHEDTINQWKKRYPEFSVSIKRGKTIADMEIANKLFKRASGYEFVETTKERKRGQLIVTKEVVKEIAPDPTSMIFWLKNRQKDKWRDKQHFDHTSDEDKIESVVVFQLPDNGRENN